MTSGSVEPSAPPTSPGRGNRLERLQARVTAADRRIRRFAVVKSVINVLDTYNLAGGGMTAGGLAYGALFAVVPGMLLIVSVLVLVIDNQTSRDQVITWLTEQVPPLKEFAGEIVTNLAQSAKVGSIIGLVGFIWGASGFYVALESAMERLFPGPRRRDPVTGRVRGVIGVMVLVGAVLAAFLVNSLVSFLPQSLLDGVGEIGTIAPHLLAIAVSTMVALVVYVIVPSDTPGWRSASWPALAAGIGIGLLTSLYTLIAPLLVGGFMGLGTIAYVFAALVWFNWVFQILLYGGAWARLRRDRRYARGVVR